jgi:hypothetical protein
VIDVLVTGCKCISHQEDMASAFYLFMYKQLSKKVRLIYTAVFTTTDTKQTRPEQQIFDLHSLIAVLAIY